jgi:hypothetical protein
MLSKLRYGGPLSNVASNCNLRHYTAAAAAGVVLLGGEGAAEGGGVGQAAVGPDG